MADFKSISLAFFIISAGISSIGVSSWQYQVVDNGITFYNSYTLQTESLSTMCSDFPYEYLRRKYFQNLNILDWNSFIFIAFSVSISSSNAYCGYGIANTAYRLALAILTVILGCLMASPLLNDKPKFTYWSLFCVSILWYSATVADSTAYINGSEACTNSFGEQSGVSCNGSSYGKFTD